MNSAQSNAAYATWEASIDAADAAREVYDHAKKSYRADGNPAAWEAMGAAYGAWEKATIAIEEAAWQVLAIH